MRDRDYTKAKPPGTYRIAVLGASHEMGDSVNDTETLENVLEDRLNDQRGRREIRNPQLFGAWPRCGPEAVATRVNAMEFQPDAVFFFTYSPEFGRTFDHLARGCVMTWAVPESYKTFLNELYEKAGVDRHTPGEVVANAVATVWPRNCPVRASATSGGMSSARYQSVRRL